MKKTWITLLLSILVLLSLILTSCGNSGEMDMNDSQSVEDSDFGYSSNISYKKSNSESLDESESSEDGDTAAKQMIIRNVTLSAQTKEYDDAVAGIRALAVEVGGYEQSVKSTGRSIGSTGVSCRNATLVLRIPAEKLDSFLGQIGGMVAVVNEDVTSDNVTIKYYDMQARLGVLESEKTAYQKILEDSTSVYDAMSIQKQLYDVIEEIESYKSQIKTMESQVSFSTVTIYLNEVVEYTAVTTVKDTFGTRLGNAFRESWQDFANGFQSFAVGVVYAIPTLLVLAAIAGIILCAVIHPTKRRRRLAAEKAKAEKSE